MSAARNQQSQLLFLLPSSVFEDHNANSSISEALSSRSFAFSEIQEESSSTAQCSDQTHDQQVGDATTTASTCRTCGVGKGGATGFASVAEQREHFKTDWHRLNVKRALAKQPPLTEAEFDALLDHDEVGSISGSDSDQDESVDGPSPSAMTHNTHILFGAPIEEHMHSANHTPTTSSTTYHAAWRAILPNPGATSSHTSASAQLRTLHAQGCRWAVILSSGGHFAACIVECAGKPKARGFVDVMRVLVHKTYHRYVVRAKAGGRQSSKDATGKYAKSAGSQLRRHNEAALERDIQATLTEWSPLLANTDLIFVHAPAVNGNAVFAGPNAPLKLSDPRVRKVPFIVRRPTFSEAKRVVHQLLQVSYITLHPVDKSPADPPTLTPPTVDTTQDNPATQQPPASHTAGVHTGNAHDQPLTTEHVPHPDDPVPSHPIAVVDRVPGQLSKSKKKRLRAATKKQRQRASAGKSAAAASSLSDEEVTDAGPAPTPDVDEIDAALAAIAAMEVGSKQRKPAAPKPPPSAVAAEERRRVLAEAAERRMAALTRASQQQAFH